MKNIYAHNKEIFMKITVKDIADYLNRRSSEFTRTLCLGALEVDNRIAMVSVIEDTIRISRERKTGKTNFLNMRYCIGKPDEKNPGEYYVFEVSKKLEISCVVNPVDMIEFLSCKRTKDEIIEHIIALSGIRVFIYEPIAPALLRWKMLVRTVPCDEVFDLEDEIVRRQHRIARIENELNRLTDELKDERAERNKAVDRLTVLTRRKVTN